jgi:hypothetical protein
MFVNETLVQPFSGSKKSPVIYPFRRGVLMKSGRGGKPVRLDLPRPPAVARMEHALSLRACVGRRDAEDCCHIRRQREPQRSDDHDEQ